MKILLVRGRKSAKWTMLQMHEKENWVSLWMRRLYSLPKEYGRAFRDDTPEQTKRSINI